MEFYLTKTDKLKLIDPQAYHSYTDSLESGRYIMTIIEDKRSELERQRDYYYGIVVPEVMKDTGEDEDTICDAMKEKFSGGQSVFSDKSKLTDAQREIYMMKVRAFWQEFKGLNIAPRGRPE